MIDLETIPEKTGEDEDALRMFMGHLHGDRSKSSKLHGFLLGMLSSRFPAADTRSAYSCYFVYMC